MQIREELRANGIDVYPQKEFDEDAEDRMINDKIRVSSRYLIQSVQTQYNCNSKVYAPLDSALHIAITDVYFACSNLSRY